MTVVFVYTNNELSQREKKANPFIIVSKNKILKNKFKQGDERPLH